MSDGELNPQAEEEQEELEESMSEAEKAALIESVESRIRTGDLDNATFHSFVVDELYPLLADGTLDQATFVNLVQAWAVRNYPYDWALKTYG